MANLRAGRQATKHKLADRLRNTPEARNSLWSLIGFGGRSVFSLFVFFAIGRSLGTGGFGDFAGVIALATLAAPLNTMGVGEALVQKVSRDPDRFSEAWGEVLLAAVSIGLVVFGLTTLIGAILFDSVSIGAIALLTAMEFLSIALVANHARACYAADHYAASAAHAVGEGMCRAVGAGVFWASGSDDLLWLGALMLGAVSVSSFVSTVWLWRSMGRPTVRRTQLLRSAREGAPFALGQSSSQIQNNVDKTMLLSYGFRDDNGIYAAGFRLIGYSTMPMMSIFQASLPEFYRQGEVGVASALMQSRRIRKPVLAAAVFGSVASVIAAPIAAWLLADQFDGVIPVAIALSAYPILKAVQTLWGDVLTGTGRQGLRARLQLATALVNVGLNVFLIPAYSWKGAAASTYVSEVLLFGLIFVGVNRARKSQRDDAAGPDVVRPVANSHP